jgi:SAM-dependent methyltransferase
MTDDVDAALVNRTLWTQINAQYTDGQAQHAWSATEITWGLFAAPERELGVLGDVAGLDVVELGSGTAYFSAWLARRGARPVAVDVTPTQLRTARRCQAQFGLSFPLIEADAEHVPLAGESFDLAVSEYGASVWCDPNMWVAEAARLLRPGGRLVFLTDSLLLTLCVPDRRGYAKNKLLRPQRRIFRTWWPGGGVEYHPSHEDWIAILRANGFAIDALHELYAGETASTHDYYEIVTSEWARQWPAEELWVATRRE